MLSDGIGSFSDQACPVCNHRPCRPKHKQNPLMISGCYAHRRSKVRKCKKETKININSKKQQHYLPVVAGSHSAHRSPAGRCCISRAKRRRRSCPDTGLVAASGESYNTARWLSCNSARKRRRRKLMEKVINKTTTPRWFIEKCNIPRCE